MKKLMIITGLAFALALTFYTGAPIEKSASTVTMDVIPGPGGGVGGN